MSIPIALGTNFDKELLGELARFNREEHHVRVTRVFGSLPSDPVGGGRPTHWLPNIDLADLQAHVAAMAALGIKFSYTINAPDLFGSEEDPAWRDRLEAHLCGLWEAGVRRLVVSNRWLLRYLRDRHEFSRTLSVIAAVNSPAEAVEFEELGVDDICLSFLRANRDLEFVAGIRAATRVELTVLANSGSLVGCRQADDHYRLLGRQSRQDRLGAADDMIPADPFVLRCSLRMLADPTLFVRNATIPPGYLDKFVAAGVDRFKLTERCSPTASLMAALRTYASPEPVDDMFPGVLKGGTRLRLGLRGLFPNDFLRELRLPGFHIDGRRFAQERFIERQPTMSKEEMWALADSLVTVLDPDYLERFRSFYEEVNKLVAGRSSIPTAQLPEFHALRRLL